MTKIRTCFLAQGLAVLFLVGFFCLVARSATNPAAGSPPRIGHGAEEYLKLTGESVAAVREALRVLDRVGAQTNRCPPKVVAAFSHEVDQLLVESFRIRCRAQAIQARGDAYFEAWSANPASTNSPLAGKASGYLSQMRQAFSNIKLASKQTGDEFRPFLAGLRSLRVQLETNPDVIGTGDTKELIRTTHEHGSEVVEKLGALKAELQAVIPVLKEAKAKANL